MSVTTGGGLYSTKKLLKHSTVNRSHLPTEVGDRGESLFREAAHDHQLEAGEEVRVRDQNLGFWSNRQFESLVFHCF